MEIKIEDFELKYDDRYILEIKSFEINSKRLQILGRNGTGKTSFLDVIYKINEDYSGSIKLNGVDIRIINKGVIRDYISYINQDFKLLLDLTVRENIKLFSNDFNKVVDLLRELKPEINISSKVNQLSGGQKQTVNFAIGFCKSSKIVFLDEIFNYLDTEVSYKIIDLINSDRRDIIFITHKDKLVIEDKIQIEERGFVHVN